jgi:hypothetical protein
LEKVAPEDHLPASKSDSHAAFLKIKVKKMFRNFVLASALIAGFSGVALAQEPLTVLGTGENFAVDYSNDGGNILGGGAVRVIGHGESAVYQHASDAPAQHGWTPHVVSQGEAGRVTYSPAPSANPAPLG